MKLYDEDATEEYLLDHRYAVQPMKHSHWIIITGSGARNMCANCRSKYPKPYKYCPHCGSKMDQSTMNQVNP